MDRNFYRDYAIAVFSLTVLMILAVVCIDRLITPADSAQPLPQGICYVIDAGHGGEDGGAVSVNGLTESDINLQIATKLNSILILLGRNTCMLRVDDRDLHTEGSTIAQRKRSDLSQRVHKINSVPNGVLVSIHQNFFADDRYSGLQVFYAGNNGSKPLAESIQAAYKAALNPASRRVVQRAKSVYLMEHIKCPGVLIECGFLSNAAEEALLTSASYQIKLSITIATALVNSLQENCVY